MKVRSLPEAEYLIFKNHMVGDTVDASFVAQYNKGVHDVRTKVAWMKLSTTIMNPYGSVLQRVKVKNEDYASEWAGPIIAKSNNPHRKAELRPCNLCKSKNHKILFKRSKLYGNKSQKERSISPIFGLAMKFTKELKAYNKSYQGLKKSPSRVYLLQEHNPPISIFLIILIL